MEGYDESDSLLKSNIGLHMRRFPGLLPYVSSFTTIHSNKHHIQAKMNEQVNKYLDDHGFEH